MDKVGPLVLLHVIRETWKTCGQFPLECAFFKKMFLKIKLFSYENSVLQLSADLPASEEPSGATVLDGGRAWATSTDQVPTAWQALCRLLGP